MMKPLSRAELTEEIKALILSGIESEQPQSAAWITQLVLDGHTDIHGDDTAFYLRCALEHVRDQVLKIVGGLKPDAKGKTNPEWQMTLEGFDHIQKAYLIDRDGDQTIVPITLCTRVELDVKIAEYESMAAGCLAHAKELKRYRQSKFGF